MKQLFFTVTNDLTYDQRMHRICTSLHEAGFGITLVGRKLKNSIPFQAKPYQQQRLRCLFNKGFLFYSEYNLRLFFFLVRKKMDGICAIDLDTILPCLFVSRLKRIHRVYDAHEYFTELKEVRTRPFISAAWNRVQGYALPRYRFGYTVTEGLAREFKLRYSCDYKVIRNLPVLQPLNIIERENFLIYQGAVNEGRGFEVLIPAMKQLPYQLIICGDGNFMERLKALIRENRVGDKVTLKGMLLPEELRVYAAKAALGIGLAEKEGINQYYALPNKFLDYMHAGLPQIAMNFPEYKRINDHYPVAVLLDELSVAGVATAIHETMQNTRLRSTMQDAALQAREVFCWQREEKKLVGFYKTIFS